MEIEKNQELIDQVRKFTKIELFLEWVFENRYNAEISNEYFLNVISLSCENFKSNLILGTKFLTSLEKEKIKKHILAGNKLEAVKLLKEIAKISLLEAKEYIDNFVV